MISTQFPLKIFLITTLSVIVSFTAISESVAESSIPDWIKDMTRDWSEDKISNEEFAEGVNYMIKNKLLSLSEVEYLVAENQKLKNEMNDLQSQLTQYEQMSSFEKTLEITVHTNKSQFGPGDDILIFGTVNYLVDDHEVGIVISESSGKILGIAKIPPNEDKSYGFAAKNTVFRQSGDYSVHVYYGGQAYADTDYSYRPISP